MKLLKNNKIILYSLIIVIAITVNFWLSFDTDQKMNEERFVLNTFDLKNRINNDENDIQDVNQAGLNSIILRPQYYYGKFVQETVKMNISDELYDNYRGIGDVEHTVSLKPVKVAAYNGIISFRYINDVHSTIDTMDMALDFRLELERVGYDLTINSNHKKVYEGNQYKVVILTEFNYLIIVIIEK